MSAEFTEKESIIVAGPTSLQIADSVFRMRASSLELKGRLLKFQVSDGKVLLALINVIEHLDTVDGVNIRGIIYHIQAEQPVARGTLEGFYDPISGQGKFIVKM